MRQPAAQARRQRVADLLQPRVQELVDVQQLRLGHLDLAAHALEAAGAQLQVGHAHGVLVAHPQRQVARGLHRQFVVAGGGDARHALQVQRAVGRVLVVDEPAQAFAQPGPCGFAELAVQRASAAHRRPGAHGSGGGSAGAGRAAGPAGGGGSMRQPQAFAEGAQAGLDADPAARIVASKASRPKGSVADAHSAPNSTALMTLPLRSAGRGHVEADEALRRVQAGGFQRRAVGRAVAQRRSSRRWHRRGGWRRSAWCGPSSPGRAAPRGRLPSARRRCSTSTSPGVGISASTGAAPAASAAARGNSSR